MIRLLTAVLLFASLNVAADDLKTFSDGQVIEADDFNHNFQKLEQDIADIPAGPKGDKGDTGDQGIQGEQGPAGADGVAAGLNCTTDQSIVYRGGAWVCSSPEVVSQYFDSSGGIIACPSDKKVTGGGCEFRDTDVCVLLLSRPASDLTFWECDTLGNTADCKVTAGYAICQ